MRAITSRAGLIRMAFLLALTVVIFGGIVLSRLNSSSQSTTAEYELPMGYAGAPEEPVSDNSRIAGEANPRPTDLILDGLDEIASPFLAGAEGNSDSGQIVKDRFPLGRREIGPVPYAQNFRREDPLARFGQESRTPDDYFDEILNRTNLQSGQIVIEEIADSLHLLIDEEAMFWDQIMNRAKK